MLSNTNFVLGQCCRHARKIEPHINTLPVLEAVNHMTSDVPFNIDRGGLEKVSLLNAMSWERRVGVMVVGRDANS